ncbi:MAG: radical SAM protein [Methanobacteriota archaeon]|nr:MAG: radical SAM protein [Euryarchaeota archaeon]
MEELLGVRVPPPRDDFAIREVTVDTALRANPLPGLDYSLNPYVGCYHGCVFCYVPRIMQIDRAAWGTSVVVKRNLASVLAREIRKLPRGLVAISTATDPYQFVEGRYRITRNALEVLLRAGWPVSILSRSGLMLRDVDLFTQFSQIEVGMSIPTLDDEARALLEPWAPPIESRLRCLGKLAEAGLTTFVSIAPAYPPTGGWDAASVADAFARAGVRKASTRLLDARWGVRDAMLARLEGSSLAPELARISDRPYMESYLAALADASEARGIAFRRWDTSRRSGFYGPHTKKD